MIKKVEFSLHESFPEPLITINEAPFEIHNAGYGEFPIAMTIYFQDPYERPLEYTH
jgi:transcription initiation factor IIF auxiliary subunit